MTEQVFLKVLNENGHTNAEYPDFNIKNMQNNNNLLGGI